MFIFCWPELSWTQAKNLVLSVFLIPLKFAIKELKIRKMTSILMLRWRASAWISNFGRGFPSPFTHYNVFEVVNILATPSRVGRCGTSWKGALHYDMDC